MFQPSVRSAACPLARPGLRSPCSAFAQPDLLLRPSGPANLRGLYSATRSSKAEQVQRSGTQPAGISALGRGCHALDPTYRLNVLVLASGR